MTETSAAQPTSAPTGTSAERADLIALLDRHRGFFLHTANGLTDEQARLTPTVSSLSVGGLVKHVSATVSSWLDFIEHGAAQPGEGEQGEVDAAAYEAFTNGFRLLPTETLAGVIAEYDAVHARAVELARTVDLNTAHALPEAPWFAKESWTNRRVLVHIIAETAQHSGHADIIRESIDGQHTMG